MFSTAKSRLAWLGALAAGGVLAVGLAGPRPAAPTIDSAIDLVVRRYVEDLGWDQPGALPDGRTLTVYVNADGVSLDGLARGWRDEGLELDVSPYLADMPQGRGVVFVRHDTSQEEAGIVKLLVSSGEVAACWRTEAWRVESSLFGLSARMIGAVMSCQ